MQLRKWSSLALLPTLAGCATVGMMNELPPDVGTLAVYAAPPDTLVAAAEETIVQQHLRLADTSRPDADTRVMIARRPPGLFSNGEYVRVRISRDSGGLMAVRVVTRPGYLLEVGHRERAPRVFEAMDARLDARALGPWPGMRVRATPRGASPIIGTVARVTADTLVLGGGIGNTTVLRISALDGLAVSRGSYRHVREGALIGALVGALIGGVLGGQAEETSSYYQGLNVFAGVLVGAAAGGVVGGVAGASVRTEVWSPLPIH